MNAVNDDYIKKCPKCKTKNLFEIANVKEGTIKDFCINCNYQTIPKLIKYRKSLEE